MASEQAPQTDGPDARLVLIGTGHVFRIESAIRGAILALRPDVVFVELDQGRLNALLHRERTGQSPGRGGFVHQRLQRFQEGVAQLYGAQVGNEMLAAVRAAREVGARVALIDAPGEDTVKRALASLTVKERLRAVGQLVGAGVKRLLPQRKDARQAMEAEIKRYEEDPDAAIDELRRQYPTVWRVLIDERDEGMASAIRATLTGGAGAGGRVASTNGASPASGGAASTHAAAASRGGPPAGSASTVAASGPGPTQTGTSTAAAPRPVALGVAVLGDGHVPGVLARLAGIQTQVYRLTDVRNDRLPRPEGVASGSSQAVSFSFDLDVA